MNVKCSTRFTVKNIAVCFQRRQTCRASAPHKKKHQREKYPRRKHPPTTAIILMRFVSCPPHCELTDDVHKREALGRALVAPERAHWAE